MRGAGPAVPSTEHLRLPAAPARTQPAAPTASAASSRGGARSFCTRTGTLRSLPADWAHPGESPAPPAAPAPPRLRQGTRPRRSHMAEPPLPRRREAPAGGRHWRAAAAGAATPGAPGERGEGQGRAAGAPREQPREKPRPCPSSPGRARRRRAVPPAAGGCAPGAPGVPPLPARPPGSLLMDYRDKEGSRLFPACLRAVTCRLRRHRALPTAPARREQLPPELQGGLQESTRKEIFSLAYFLLFTSRLMASLMHQHQRIMIFHHRLLPFASYTGAVRLRAKKYNWPHFLKPFTCPQTCPTFINWLPG